MKFLLRGLILLVAASSLPAAAADTIIIGPGAQTCGDFGRDYAKFGRSTSFDYYYWAEGYLSGIQVGLPEKERVNLFPKGFSPEEQEDFIRRFCASNPLHTYDVAVGHLYNAIRKANGRKPILNLPP